MDLQNAINLALVAIFFIVTISLARQGLWSSLVMLLNVLAAASFATAWHGWLAEKVDPDESLTPFVDLVCLQGLFAIAILLFREFTDRASKHRLKFHRLTDRIGAPIVAAIVAWIVVAFNACSLHVLPLSREAIQPTPETRLLFGLSPDRKWLQWVRGSSLYGPFARPDVGFDRGADFIIRHADRRWRNESQR